MGINLEKQKIKKMGDYHFISIPKALMDNGILNLNREYRVIFEEIEDQKIQNQNNKNRSQEVSS